MEETIYSINGKIVPAEQAVVPVTDRGFLYGDGIFETMHAYGATLFCMRPHLLRLADAAKHLRFEPAPDLVLLEHWLKEAIVRAEFPEANVRLTYTRGCGPRGPSLKGRFSPTVVISVTRYERPAESRLLNGVSAVMSGFRRQEASATAKLKTLNYIEQILARREADEAGADEALLLNNAGLLCEGSASNISLVREGVLTYPDPERAGALPGIAQLTAIEAARNIGVPVLATVLSPWDAWRSEEAFLSGSMREITPLARVGENQVGDGKPGPVTKKIIAEYRRIVERECKPFKFSARVRNCAKALA
jgi:branched-chain amino acid aminotransferase